MKPIINSLLNVPLAILSVAAVSAFFFAVVMAALGIFAAAVWIFFRTGCLYC